MRCDLDPNKICDNCGKCLAVENHEDEFRSIVVDAAEIYENNEADFSEDLDDSELTEEEKLFNAFLDQPVDLQLPEPIEVDKELAEKWERILQEAEEKERQNEEPDLRQPEIGLRGKRRRTRR